MINKAIIAGSFDFDFPAMRLVPLHSRGIDREFFTKSAAVLTKEIDEVRPEQGKACIHLIATGDQETYGINRNGDGFPKIANIERHHTFVTDAHAFKHHVNKDPKTASGVVKASAYNPNMYRTELLVIVDEGKWSQSLDKLANDELAPVSMACRVPYDECTLCHNHAKTRADYCDCLTNNITKVAANGIHIGAINRYPTYFDISEVHRNADRIAFGLQKVAAAAVMSGAELAEHLGLDIPHILFEPSSDPCAAQKLAALEHLARMEKEIEGVIAGKADKKGIHRLLPATHTESVSEKDAEALHRADPRAIFGYLAKEGVCLPIEGFYRVVYGSEYDTVAAQVEKAAECLPGIFTKLSRCPEKATEDGSYDANGGAVAPPVRDLIHKLARRMSMHEGPAVTRITITAVRQKPTKLAAVTVKEASAEADFMASEYAKYQLSYVTGMENSGSDRILMLTALQNYVK